MNRVVKAIVQNVFKGSLRKGSIANEDYIRMLEQYKNEHPNARLPSYTFLLYRYYIINSVDDFSLFDKNNQSQ